MTGVQTCALPILRSGNGTQKEHMEVARACAKVIAAIFPMAAELVAQD